ncbi:MAG: RidA family protein [Acidobacteriales bacterium]|nr:RidA family protein [Terriglobales bacterium]
MTARYFKLLLATLLVSCTFAAAQGGKSVTTKKSAAAFFINPPGLSTPRGYSHVAEVRSGRLAFIAGQVALDAKGNIVGVNDFRAQANQVFENLRIALRSVGADFGGVIKINTYILDMGQLPVLREVRDKYFADVPHRPASTLVQVQKLAQDQFLIEIEAVAVIPEK